MDSTLVLYSSHYGSTRRYAEWIAQELKVQAQDIRKVSSRQIRDAQNVVFGGGLYAGGIIGVKKLMGNIQPSQRVCVFTCGIANPEVAENRAHIRASFEKRFGKQAGKVQLFHVRGEMDYSRMSFKHRAMMTMMRRVLQNKPADQRTEEDEQVLATYGGKIGFVSKEQIKPIVKWAKSV